MITIMGTKQMWGLVAQYYNCPKPGPELRQREQAGIRQRKLQSGKRFRQE